MYMQIYGICLVYRFLFIYFTNIHLVNLKSIVYEETI